ncbi:MAG TPA: hypothetical protein VFI31_17780 [Pirellulales bacterium]|nr:hypothetical protein [Pirellulales bacterium]
MQTTSRRLAREWARTSAPFVESQLMSGLDHADERDINCTFAIARELTNSNTPFLLSYYAREIFVFELTQRQAKSFRAINRRMQCVEGGPTMRPPSAAPPLYDLSDLRIVDADGHPAEEAVRGTVYYEQQGDECFPGRVFLSMEFDLLHQCRKTLNYYPQHGLLPEGELEFTFPPAVEEQNQHGAGELTGPIVVHVRLMGTMNPQAPGGRVALSNAAAAVVELM